MKGYRYIKDLTSDVAFEAKGKDLPELFRNAGIALCGIVCKVEVVGRTSKMILKAEGKTDEELLFNWLQEIIAAIDIDELFFSDFEVRIDGGKLEAVAYGEPMSPQKGSTLVKAITKHKFELKRLKDGYKAFVTVDI